MTQFDTPGGLGTSAAKCSKIKTEYYYCKVLKRKIHCKNYRGKRNELVRKLLRPDVRGVCWLIFIGMLEKADKN